MHRVTLPLCLVFAFASLTFAQQPAPATAPASVSMLLKNEIAYPTPPGWKLIGVNPEDRRAGYSLDDQAQLVIQVMPQNQTIPDSLGPTLKKQVLDALKAEAARGTIEQLGQPTVESDARFLLKIHDVFISQGKHADRMQFHRGVGRNLVTVVAVAFSEDPQQAKSIHDLAEQLALGVRLNRPGASSMLDQVVTMPQPAAPNPTSPGAATMTKHELFKEAKLRIAAPAGWKAEPTNKPSGMIVVWRDPEDSTNLITLSYRLIPASARNSDNGMRSIAITELARGEKPDFQAAGAKPIGATTTVNDKRFLRKTKSEYEVKGSNVTVGFRQVRAGDGVVSITSISLSDKAATIDELGDKIATEVRSTGL